MWYFHSFYLSFLSVRMSSSFIHSFFLSFFFSVFPSLWTILQLTVISKMIVWYSQHSSSFYLYLTAGCTLHHVHFTVASIVKSATVTWSRGRGYKTFFMLTSAETKIILLINVKMPTIFIVVILTFISSKNY